MEIASEWILCMALNIFHEARGEPFAGQIAVAHVTFTRAKKDYTQICNVVYAPGQFTWTRYVPKHKRFHQPNYEREAWVRAVVTAQSFYHFLDPTRGANHYHTVDVRPYWVKGMKYKTTIGRHIFYYDWRLDQ